MRRAVAALLLTVLPVAGCTILRHASAVKTNPARPSGLDAVPLSTTPGGYLGVREVNAPPSYNAVVTFGRVVGQRPNLILFYSGWGERFKAPFSREVSSHGAVPLVQINPGTTSIKAIASGRYDNYLRTYARRVRAFGHPVVIGFAHEMNGTWYPWGWPHVRPRTWIAAWRHLVTVFRLNGAKNVTWLWTISSGRKHAAIAAKYWPGRSWVTWAGIDGYFYTPSSFNAVFAPEIRVIHRLDRGLPILLSETGAGQVAGQARMIPRLFAGIKRWRLLGLVWYDVPQSNGRYHQDWRIEGHRASIAAFRAGLQSMMHSLAAV
jgi:mannan endo-1,4-beta-mannosidase